jgi:hypothetical protein
MNNAERRAFMLDYNRAMGWPFNGDQIDRGDEVMLACAGAAQDRAMHRTGCAELLDYYGLGT